MEADTYGRGEESESTDWKLHHRSHDGGVWRGHETDGTSDGSREMEEYLSQVICYSSNTFRFEEEKNSLVSQKLTNVNSKSQDCLLLFAAMYFPFYISVTHVFEAFVGTVQRPGMQFELF